MKNFKNSEAIDKAMDIINDYYEGDDKYKLQRKLAQIGWQFAKEEKKAAKIKEVQKRLKDN